jgi:hypothetical protein
LYYEGVFEGWTVTSLESLTTHDIGKLLTTIIGIGSNTAAYLVAELGNPARFHSAGALASYVGVAPFPGRRCSPRQCELAKAALDADPDLRAIQSLVAIILRTLGGQW